MAARLLQDNTEYCNIHLWSRKKMDKKVSERGRQIHDI